MLADRDEEGGCRENEKERESRSRKQDVKAENFEGDGVCRGGAGEGEEEEEEEERTVTVLRRCRSVVSMSASTPSTTLATICVVDSSLPVAVEWTKIFQNYLVPIFQRLGELTSNVNQVTSRPPSPSLSGSPSSV